MRLIKKDTRYQFSLRTILIAVTVLSCMLAIWTLLPLAARQFAISFMGITLCSCFVFALLLKLDWMMADKKLPLLSAFGSIALISTCSTVISIVLLASWLQLPARSGTVQLYVNDPEGMFVFRFREAVALSLLGAPILCGLLGMLPICREKNFFRGWIFIGIVSYLISWFVIVSYGFIPMV